MSGSPQVLVVAIILETAVGWCEVCACPASSQAYNFRYSMIHPLGEQAGQNQQRAYQYA